MDRALGLLKAVMPGVLFSIVVVFFFQVLADRDATDPPSGRSGMTLLTDHGTGCQYLYRSGAITPRMDANGKQICSGQ